MINRPTLEILVLISTTSSEGSGELGNRAVTPEPSLLACIKYGSIRRLRLTIRPLATPQVALHTRLNFDFAHMPQLLKSHVLAQIFCLFQYDTL